MADSPNDSPQDDSTEARIAALETQLAELRDVFLTVLGYIHTNGMPRADDAAKVRAFAERWGVGS